MNHDNVQAPLILEASHAAEKENPGESTRAQPDADLRGCVPATLHRRA